MNSERVKYLRKVSTLKFRGQPHARARERMVFSLLFNVSEIRIFRSVRTYVLSKQKSEIETTVEAGYKNIGGQQ